MASVKPLDFDDYRAYSGSSNPTKQSAFQDYSQNQNTILTELTQTIAWQPSTSYAVGNVVYCGGGLWARCITAGTSGTTEPSWSEGNVGDGAARWTVTETVAALASAISVLNAHIANSNNPHGVTKSSVGLSAVVNTGDTATPASGSDAKFTAGGAYTELNKKVDKAQGSGNAGKVMGVGSDGNVTLIAAMPVGAVVWLAGNAAIPDGYLLCNGQAVSRTTYASLYSSIGTTYGTGDGSTTFNLPNLIDKFIEGSSTAGTSKTASVTASHYHVFGYNSADNSGFFLANANRVAFTPVAGTRGWNGAGGGGGYNASGTLSSGNMITSYEVNSGSATVQPPALTMKPVIKY